MELFATMDMTMAAGWETIASSNKVNAQPSVMYLVITMLESNPAIWEWMRMIAGWEIIARLSALIPLLLHLRPRYSPRLKHRLNFHIFESFFTKVEMILAHSFKSFR